MQEQAPKFELYLTYFFVKVNAAFVLFGLNLQELLEMFLSFICTVSLTPLDL